MPTVATTHPPTCQTGGIGAPCNSNDDCTSGLCTWSHCSVAGMVYMPPGAFFMGSPDSEIGRYGDLCNPPAAPSLDCDGYRLPTEAEWECVARAGVGTAFTNGTGMSVDSTACYAESNLSPIAWYCSNSGGVFHAVGGLAPNGRSLYDVLGNAYEWAWDGRAGYPYALVRDPQGDATFSERAFRGGARNRAPCVVRLARRSHFPRDQRESETSLRLVRSLPR